MRCDTSENAKQAALEKEQKTEAERIRADQMYIEIYKENINLRNNAEPAKSATAKVLKDTSLAAENCSLEYK